MIVVSDTSPLTYLYQIQRFALLEGLYGEVIIPPAVEQELKHAAHMHVGLDWTVLRVVQPKNRDAVDSLFKTLDLGESEAIVVASEIKADLLLIDEADGREVARRMGVRLTGLLGVLLDAKRRGLVPAVSPELERLQASTSFRTSRRQTGRSSFGKRDVSLASQGLVISHSWKTGLNGDVRANSSSRCRSKGVSWGAVIGG